MYTSSIFLILGRDTLILFDSGYARLLNLFIMISDQI